MPDNLEFHYPWVALLLALLPIYALLTGRMGRVAALKFSSAELARASGAKARSAPGALMATLRLLALALLILACAGPRVARTRVERKTEGIDIMLALDLSPSMFAMDMSPPDKDLWRCLVAKDVIRDFVDRRPDDRVGLVGFAGKPYLISPLTLNHDWIKLGLDRIDAGILPQPGTAIGEAVAMATSRMKERKGKGNRIIILLTDGDDNSSRKILPVPAAEVAAALGIRVYTIGVGIDKPTPMPEMDRSTRRPLRDAQGRVSLDPTFMLPAANYELLGRMATLSGGKFYRAKNAAELRGIYEDIGKLETSEVLVLSHVEYTELFAAFALAALGVLLAGHTLANTRYLRLP